MARVSDVLQGKGSVVHQVAPGTSAFAAVAVMVGNGVGSLLVTEGGQVTGIFTERDYLRRVLLRDLDGHATPVGEVMTRELFVVQPGRDLVDCMAIMTKHRIRHLPVVEDGRLAGVLSIGDIVKHLSREREVEIRHLTEYITGSSLG